MIRLKRAAVRSLGWLMQMLNEVCTACGRIEVN